MKNYILYSSFVQLILLRKIELFVRKKIFDVKGNMAREYRKISLDKLIAVNVHKKWLRKFNAVREIILQLCLLCNKAKMYLFKILQRVNII
jgi:hypothetical protein